MKPFSEIAPGGCFTCLVQSQTYVGIAIAPPSQDADAAFIAVSPGHPKLPGKPGVLNVSTLAGSPVLSMPAAKIVLPQSREHIHFGSDAPIGAAVLAGEQVGIVAAIYGSESWAFSLRDGTVMQHGIAAWFAEWEIAAPGVNGDWKTVCRVTSAE